MGGVLVPNDNDDVQLKGATDATLIGNVGDRLKVDSSFSSPPRTTPSFLGNKTRIVDMNVVSGGVARGTGIASTSVYTTIFSYTGSGHLFSFLVSLEGNLFGSDDYNIRLTIDGTDCFIVDTADIGSNTLYGLVVVGDENSMAFSVVNNIVRFNSSRGGLYYASSVAVAVKKATSATSRQFRAGMVYLTKET